MTFDEIWSNDGHPITCDFMRYSDDLFIFFIMHQYLDCILAARNYPEETAYAFPAGNYPEESVCVFPALNDLKDSVYRFLSGNYSKEAF